MNWSISCFCVNLVSLLQRQVDENWSLQWASQLMSLLQWYNQNWSLQWASRSLHSESAIKTLSMQWSIYSHRLIYQWIWFYIHVQIVSLLQWQVESWSLWWASWLVSLLQWHSSSMQWSIYSHCSIYQWIDLSRVHMQLVSLLQ